MLPSAVVEQILSDPAFHANLNARAKALAEGTHPEDLQQNTDAAAIVAQAQAATEARDSGQEPLAQMQAQLTLGSLLSAYVNKYFPNL